MDVKLMGLGLLATVGGGAYLATGPEGEFYPIPREEVSARLVTAQLPREAGGEGAGDLVARAYRRGAGEVIWEFSIVNQPLATFSAVLTPEGDGTRVHVDFTMADTDLGDAAREDFGEGMEFMTGMIEIALAEHVDATLEKRPFDEDAVGKGMAKLAISNPSAARALARRAHELDATGGPSALESELRSSIEREAAWHSDAPMLDTRGASAQGMKVNGADVSGTDPTPSTSW